MARTWLITDSIPNFYPYFQLRTNRRKPNMHLSPITLNALLLVAHLQLPHNNSLQAGHTWSLPFCPLASIPTPLPALESATVQMSGSLTTASSEYIALACSRLVGLHFYLSQLQLLNLWNGATQFPPVSVILTSLMSHTAFSVPGSMRDHGMNMRHLLGGVSMIKGEMTVLRQTQIHNWMPNVSASLVQNNNLQRNCMFMVSCLI